MSDLNDADGDDGPGCDCPYCEATRLGCVLTCPPGPITFGMLLPGAKPSSAECEHIVCVTDKFGKSDFYKFSGLEPAMAHLKVLLNDISMNPKKLGSQKVTLYLATMNYIAVDLKKIIGLN